jgi:VIT1/CCC1 family predicted Fe2+/Mn2+ transporter
MLKVRWHMLLARIFGITFAVKLMERVEVDAAETYRELGLHELAEEEDAHEAKLIGMLEEDRLQYAGSIVLGMSDALVELTGALAGLTFAFGDLKMVAVAGLVMGIAAAFSMGASEFLSTRAEKSQQSPVKAAFMTWLSYLLTVLLLVAPYLIIGADSPDRYGFKHRFLEMTGILAVVSLISYAIGIGLRSWLGA